MKKSPKIIFLNQMSGKLFRELAEDLAQKFSPSIMFTGQADSLKAKKCENLKIIPAPKYKRTSTILRLLTWLQYYLYVIIRTLFFPRTSLLFLVSNPPFLGLLGLTFKLLRRQKYVILVYDIYPDVLIKFGKLKPKGLITRIWRSMNRVVYQNAEAIFTIGEYMAKNVKNACDSSKTAAGKVISIQNWADVDWIKPVNKTDNPFAIEHNQTDKLTVLYSGNLGATHDIETLLEAALGLKNDPSIHFMFIGEGAKWPVVIDFQNQYKLNNLTILPFQPENTLPYSLPTGDIAVISLDKGSEGLMVPSKTYPAMAAGSALIGLCVKECEVAGIISQHNCGVLIAPGDVDSLVATIKNLSNDKTNLRQMQKNCRQAAVEHYSRKNTTDYASVISQYVLK